MKKRFYAAALPACLAAAALFIEIPSGVYAQVISGVTELSDSVPSGDSATKSGHGSSETTSADAGTEEGSFDGITGTASDEISSSLSEEQYISEAPEEDPGIRREKYYLLEALDTLQEKGFSPILIWSKITGNEKIMDAVRNAGQSAADTASKAVQETAAAAGEAVSEKVQEEVRKTQKSFWEKLKEWFSGLWDSATGTGKETDNG